MLSKNVVINDVKNVGITEEEIDPNNIGPKESLIAADTSFISSGTELSRVYGLKEGAVYPHYPGYCMVGKIIAVGNEVEDITVGDRVLFNGPHSSLQFYDPAKSTGGVLYKLNSETTSIEGAFLNMCWIAMNGILPVDVKLGDTVAVMGLGTLGVLTSIYYQQMGVKVIGLDPVKHRADNARKNGINQIIDCKPEDQLDQIMKNTNGQGVDIVVDATGLSHSIETAVQMAATFGQVILLGSPRVAYKTNMTTSFRAIHMKMLTVIGALNSRYPYQIQGGTRLSVQRGLAYIEDLLNKKIIDVDKFVSHIIRPDEKELMTAYDGLMNKKSEYTGVVIDWRTNM